jgi:hypothetical protein
MSESKHTEEKEGVYFEKKTSDRNELVKHYIHNIRNVQILDNEMIANIRDMSSENKMDIILSLNVVLKYLKQVCDI